MHVRPSPGNSLLTKLNQARAYLQETPPDCDSAEVNLESFDK